MKVYVLEIYYAKDRLHKRVAADYVESADGTLWFYVYTEDGSRSKLVASRSKLVASYPAAVTAITNVEELDAGEEEEEELDALKGVTLGGPWVKLG